MKKFKAEVNKDVVDYIERLTFEVEGMKAIVKEIVLDAQTNPALLDGEGFKKYNKDYQERHAKLEVAKQEMLDNLLPDISKTNKLNSWSLDFATRILTFEVTDNNYKNDKATEVE